MSTAPSAPLPRWVDYGVLPLINLLLAFIVSGLVVVAIGENPFDAFLTLVDGAFGSQEGIGYTVYYATDMVFVGLAVAIAFHCGLFNIGGDGQAYIGGLGVGLVCLYLDFLPFWAIVPVAIIAGLLFGAAWAAIPAWLQAFKNLRRSRVINRSFVGIPLLSPNYSRARREVFTLKPWS